MKKLNFFLCFCVLTCVTFISCSKSDDGSVIIPGNESYWPFKTANAWKLYNDVEKDTNEIKIFHTVNFQGKDYFSFINQDDEVSYPLAVREENGIFKMYYAPTEQQDAEIGGGVITYINTTKAVNETWTENMTLTFKSSMGDGTLTYTHTGRILEKSNSESIYGRTYKDVIKTELIQKITNSLTNEITETKEVYWLSKGVGPIRVIFSGEDYSDTYSLIEYKLN